jgi:hypothetical protein
LRNAGPIIPRNRLFVAHLLERLDERDEVYADSDSVIIPPELRSLYESHIRSRDRCARRCGFQYERESGLGATGPQQCRAKEVNKFHLFIRQRVVSIQAKDAAAKMAACHKLVLSIGHIKLGREALQRHVITIEEEGLNSDAAVVLPEKAVTIRRYEGDEIFAQGCRGQARSVRKDLEDRNRILRVDRGDSAEAGYQRERKFLLRLTVKAGEQRIITGEAVFKSR